MRNHRLGALMTCLLTAVALLVSAPAAAHPAIPTDSSRIDWFGRGPSAPNVGEIARDSAGRGEFVWTDARPDQRMANTSNATGVITREVDLARFNVTADTTNLYFLAKMDRISGITNDPSPELMIAIDSDAAHTGGLTALPDGVATNVDGAAKWEYVVQTQFTSTAPTAKPIVYTNISSSSCATCAAQLLSAAVRQGSFIEIAVPWDQIGGQPDPANTLRFTVMTHYSDKRIPADGIASKAIDLISPLSTVAELTGDSTINSYIDLHFAASGDVFAPLLISEFLPDPPTSRDPEGEWIEIFNPNSFAVSLQGYKIGDQAYRGGSQGMLQLPDQLLAAGQAVVVVNNSSVFQSRYPNVPASKLIDMTTLTPYRAWASGNVSLQNTNNGLPFKESVALLDLSDTLIDLVQYTTPVPASGLDPDNRPISLDGYSVTPNASYDRCPSSADTSNSGFDFVIHTTVAEQTPGLACLGVPGVDLRIAKIGPEIVAPGTIIPYTITFSNAGTDPQSATNVVVTDTLPLGITFVSQSSTTPGLTFNGASADGRSMSWSIAALAPGASGTIVLSAAIDASLAPNTLLTNTAGINSSVVEDPANRHNNFATYTTITEGPADLTLSSTWPETAAPKPGEQFTYTINYINNGADDASDVMIIDRLPANVSLVSASAPGLSFNNASSGDLIWRTSTLAFQESGSITLVVQIGQTVAPGTVLTNQITISSNPADTPTTNNSETKSLTVGKYLLYLPMTARV